MKGAITLKQIRYILAVEKTLHFHRAAELCALSPSALSSAISEMERQLGFTIFERDNKKVLITPLGQRCLDLAQEIQLQVDDLQSLGRRDDRPLSHPLSLGVIPTIGPYLLPRVLPAVRRDYPHFPLRIVEEQSRVLVEQVRKGALDTAVLALPYDTRGLLTFPFWAEDFYWITHIDEQPGAPLAVDAAALKHSRLMLLKEGHCLKDHALAACRLQQSETDSSLASTSLYTLVQMVAGRMGSTLVPAMALEQLVSRNPDLRASPLSEPGPHRRIAFIARPNFTGVDDIRLLMETFRQALEQTD